MVKDNRFTAQVSGTVPFSKAIADLEKEVFHTASLRRHDLADSIQSAPQGAEIGWEGKVSVLEYPEEAEHPGYLVFDGFFKVGGDGPLDHRVTKFYSTFNKAIDHEWIYGEDQVTLTIT